MSLRYDLNYTFLLGTTKNDEEDLNQMKFEQIILAFGLNPRDLETPSQVTYGL